MKLKDVVFKMFVWIGTLKIVMFKMLGALYPNTCFARFDFDEIIYTVENLESKYIKQMIKKIWTNTKH